MYPSQQNATDQTANFFWVLAMIAGAILLVWWLYRPLIVSPVFWIRIHEVAMLSFFAGITDSILRTLHLPAPKLTYMHVISQYMRYANPHHITFNVFAHINSYLGRWMRWPVIVILLALAAFIRFKHKGSRFRTTYEMNTLKKVGVENWPQITPVLSLDLIKADIEKGPWAMAKLPLDFCKENNLTFLKQDDDRQIWGLHHAPAQRLFALQLGTLWKGPNALPIYLRALAVIFLSRAYRDSDTANKLLSQIAASASSGKLDFTGVDDLFAKLQKHDLVGWLEQRHAYVATYMMSLLETARKDGVLATSEFLWLKPLDRRMWYSLNTVGRTTSVVEVAGVYAHWLAEKAMGRAMKTPMVKEAVIALETDLANTLHISEEKRWRHKKAVNEGV